MDSGEFDTAAGGDLIRRLPDEYRGLCPEPLLLEPCVRCDRSETLLLTLCPRSVTLLGRLKMLLSRLCTAPGLSAPDNASVGNGGLLVLSSSKLPYTAPA